MRRSNAPSQVAKRARVSGTAVVPRSRARTATIPRQIRNTGTGFPKLFTMKHSYFVIPHTMTQTAGGPIVELYSCNGMYDPEVALGGHQPLYFDQMTAIYQHYTVIASKLTAEFTIDDTSVYKGGATVGIYLEDDALGGPTQIQTLCEQPGAVHKALAYDDKITLSKSWNARQAFGGNTMDNNELRGNSGANPLETQSWAVFAFGGLTDNIKCRVDLTIEYTAVWEELKPIGTS